MKKGVLFLSFIFVFSFVLSVVSAWDSGWSDIGNQNLNKCCKFDGSINCGGGGVCKSPGGYSCNTDGSQYNLNWLSLANVCSGGDTDGDYTFLCQQGYCNLLRGAGVGKGPLPDLIPGNYFISLQADWDGFSGQLKVGASSTLNYGDVNAEKVATNSFNDNSGIVSCTFRNTFNFASSSNGKIWVRAEQANIGLGSVKVYKIRVSDALPSDTTYYCEDEVTITRNSCTPAAEICDGADNDCDNVVDNGACNQGGVCTPAGDCQGNLICDSTGHCNPAPQASPVVSMVNWTNSIGQVVNSINLGNEVVMNVSGSNLNGQYINYTVSNESNAIYSIVMQLGGLSWTPNSVGNYTFTARVVSNGASGSSGNLAVRVNPLPNIASYCIAPGSLWYDNATGSNYSTLTTEFCGGVDRIAGGTADCCPTTGGTYQCVTTGSDKGCKIISTNTLYCNYYNTINSCNADSLTLRLNEYQYGAQGCGTTISNGSAQYNISCVCNWDANRCKFGKNVTTPSGGTGPGNDVVSSCIFDTVLGQCVNGQQTATTIGKLTAGNDPSCKNETITIPCGRKVLDLPFFGLLQFTISLLGIALIYSLFSRKLLSR
jgi:hypothetical protein